MTLNRELAEFTLEFLEKKEEAVHNQDVWFDGLIDTPITGFALAEYENVCGSEGCFAGWASLFAGWHQLREVRFGFSGNRIIEGSDKVVDETGRVVGMQIAAMEALGLSLTQAGALFNSENDRDDLRKMVNALLENEDASLWEMNGTYVEQLTDYNKEVANAYAEKCSAELLMSFDESRPYARGYYQALKSAGVDVPDWILQD